jgi:hypothetical protein
MEHIRVAEVSIVTAATPTPPKRAQSAPILDAWRGGA